MALAKLGAVILQKGVYDNTRILSYEYVAMSAQH